MLYSEKALQIVFTSSQTYTIDSKWKSADVFLVNGGNGGMWGSFIAQDGGNGRGGGGGLTKLQNQINITNREIIINIGAGGIGAHRPSSGAIPRSIMGGNTSITIDGTTYGPPDQSALYSKSQNGGSGGGGNSNGSYSSIIPNGGTDGGDGNGYRNVGTGQGTTTKAFGLNTEPAYAGGGGAGQMLYSGTEISNGSGGILGGGSGGYSSGGNNVDPQPGTANTGGGGGGGRGVWFSGSAQYVDGANGGSGIAIIRLYKGSSRPTNIDWTKNTITL